jgi:hypothetical protein
MGTFDDFMIEKAVKDGAKEEKLRARITELEKLLQELIDIEGPQPGHIMWATKVKAALAKPRTFS